ncbi:MAG: hypothetical protein P0119_06745 [Nitrospira sp.]|nr:hypothetical protein [Nitrospira sp.]
MNTGLIPLTPETEAVLEAVRTADILVGIPSLIMRAPWDMSFGPSEPVWQNTFTAIVPSW